MTHLYISHKAYDIALIATSKSNLCKLCCFSLQLYVTPHVRMGESVWSQVSAIVSMAGKETAVEHVRMYVSEVCVTSIYLIS